MTTPTRVARIIDAHRKGCTEVVSRLSEDQQLSAVVAVKATDVLELIGEIDRLQALVPPVEPVE